MQDNFALLPHTLSFHQARLSEPLAGLDADILNEPLLQNQPLDQALADLMCKPRPERLLQRLQQYLARQPDPWPLPQPLRWQNWLDSEELPPLSPEQRRTHQIFEQLLRDRRKSGKYLQAFEALCAAYPDSESLQQLRLAYYLDWAPLPRAREAMQAVLADQPGFLFVRLMLARTYLQEDDLDTAGFCASLNQRLTLHEHLDSLSTPLTELLVYQFHLDLFLFFSLQGHMARAAWCFHTCAQAVSDPAILTPLAPFVLSGLPEDQLQPGLRQLLRLLC
ncbi:MAG: hypothetical protein IGS03_04540 [Candidatus Sericytochromatia bacterium]|nr:hypothetical protein [Candidatus Sericytochromatia bacterium]